MTGFGMDRRQFLATTAAGLVLPTATLAAPVTLRAEPVTAQILPEGDGATAMLGFNGSTPGPELRVRQGEVLAVRFENAIHEGTAVHWHGVRLPNAMDGVPGLTQPLVAPGQGFDYSFAPPDAGTFWYHSHHQSWEQVARGLYGPLIVEETVPPAIDHDITVVIDDWRLEENGDMMGGFGAMHDFAHAGRLGNFARAIPSVDRVRAGDRVRLRLINTATARVFPVVVSGIEGRIVAYDGMPLETPEAIGALRLAPAQRIDLIADVVGPVEFLFPVRGDPYKLGELVVEGVNPQPFGGPIPALPAAALPDVSGETDHVLALVMEGGAMGGRHAGSDIWAFNGVSGLPEAPWQRFERGATATITLVNDTAFDHGVHLHGHHFREVAVDGTLGPWRDTSLVAPGESRDIRCAFDNPGKWLLHCHMLGHQASGMKTWIEVA